jgi:hypothetical protein
LDQWAKCISGSYDFEKTNSDNIGKNITTLNLYIPNANALQNRIILKESIKAFIFDKFLPRVVEEFQKIYIFSDTNADFLNLENTAHGRN